MIARYSRPAMSGLWSEEKKFKVLLEVELLACEAHAELGAIPREAARTIRAKAGFDVARINEIEARVKHDVIAFLTAVGERVGPESRFIHLGMTSSDILDTGLAVQMRDAAALLIEGHRKLAGILARRAVEFRDTPMVGRTHGVHAEPTTFGLKLALWYEETLRNIARLERAKEGIAVGKISGAVGTYAHVDPFVEKYVCEKLGLAPAPVSTQIVQRDRHAEFMAAIAVAGSSLEKIAVEIRHLQRTEVLEAEEYFSEGQKGSSAMPHKRNPVTCERIAGLARVLRGNAQAAMENVALWHERDISHSSVERVIVPDSCILLDYLLALAADLIDRLLVYPEHMLENLGRTHGLVFSESVLLALTTKGMSREDAYAAVQRDAMEAWKTGKDFREILRGDKAVTGVLHDGELDELFELKKSLRHVAAIFERIGLPERRTT